MNEQHRVSVIVPVFNGEKSLPACLEALRGQTLGIECLEIIVVDNGSIDNTSAVASSYTEVKLVHEATPGSYAARNAGVFVASHPLLAFTDVDCIADPRWLEAGLVALRDLGSKGFVGGRIAFTFYTQDKPSLFEQYDSLHYLNNQINIRDHTFAVTANLFTTRATIDEIGLFNPTLKSGGDREWCERAARKGIICAYASQALVYHAARNSLDSLTRKARRVVSGLHIIDRNWPSSWGFLLSQLIPPIGRIRKVLGRKELGPLSRRIALAGLMYYFKLVAFVELIYLHAGRKAERT